MSRSPRKRLSALVAATAIIVALLAPTGPAFAEDPAPDPSVTAPVETPTPEPTPSETPTPDPTPTPTPEPTATPEPTPEATETATPTPTPTPTPTETPEVETVQYVGQLNRLSDEDLGDHTDTSVLLVVDGQGFLRVDLSALPVADRSGSVNANLIVPEGLELSADEGERFQQLADFSMTVAPLVADGAPRIKSLQFGGTQGLVTQTPNTASVHQVYVVRVSPNNIDSYVDPAEVSQLVSYANTYWGEQSGGTIGFTLAGTTSNYSSAFTCTTQAGSTSLWNEAATVAHDELGYLPAKNVHLVLLFPRLTECGDSIGLGTVGGSVNAGGLVWVQGGDDLSIRKATFVHELGHNMSLGHADWLECSSATPVVGLSATNTTTGAITGCELNYYGDLVDVMGYGQYYATGGALSSPQAIRANIWPSDAWYSAGTGTNTYTINSVASNTGYRAVVVQDDDGVNYFVEFRNFVAGSEDYQYRFANCFPEPGTTGGGACAGVPGQAGVRILRMEYSGYQGVPGYDSYLIGRTLSGGVDAVKYLAGEVFWTKAGSTGVKIAVTAVTATTATIEVTRSTHVNTADIVTIDDTISVDGFKRVGNTLTAFLGDEWDAETYQYQWKRNGGAIAGATDANYVVTNDDLGATITVTVTGISVGQTNAVGTSGGYGPIIVAAYGGDQPGAVTVDNSTFPLVAVPSVDWPSGTTFAYQWLRGASRTTVTTAIPGATTDTYNPSAVDLNQFLRVRVTANIPGYAPTVRYSAAKNYTIRRLSGWVYLNQPYYPAPPRVDYTVVSATDSIQYWTEDGVLTPATFDYQWLRNGVPIPGATNPTYMPGTADFGYSLALRVIASKPGYFPLTTISDGTPYVAGGFQTFLAYPSITVGASALLPSPISQTVAVTTGTTATYEWTRINPTTSVRTIVARTATYVPVAGDYGQRIVVKLTIKRYGYEDVVAESFPTTAADYSVYATAPGTIAISGTAQVGQTLSVADVPYQDKSGNPLTVQRTYQWFRNGIAVVGATNPTYVIPSGDFGVPISVKVTAKSGPYVPLTLAAPSTPVVAKGVLVGTLAANVSLGAALKLTAVPSGVTAPTGTITYGYQWFRQTGVAAPVAIAGATGSTYTLTAADYNTRTFVRITANNVNYTSVSADSAPHGYGVIASPVVPVLVGEQRLGIDLVVGSRSYTIDGVSATPDVSYAWFRDGVAIPGTAGLGDTYNHYTPTAADAGKAISVTVTATSPLMQSSITTSAPTQKLTAFSLDGWDAPLPAVVQTPGTLKLTLPGTGVTEPTATTGYQWLRDGVAIAGATAATYTMTAADTGKLISVRATSSAPLYTSIVKFSAGIDYSIQNTAPVSIPTISTSSPSWQVGAQGQINGLAFQTEDGPLTGATYTYQWLRNGVAIPTTGLGATYDAVAADFNTATSVRVTVSKPGYLPITVTTPVTPLVLKGDLAGSFGAPSVTVSATNLLTAVITPGATTTPGVVYSYAWLRDGVAVVGTAATYQLTAADRAHTVSLRVTVTKLNFNSIVLGPTAALDYSINSALPTVSNVTNPGGAPRVGDDLVAVLPGYTTKDGSLSTPPATLSYQWFKKIGAAAPVAIIGATGAHYIVASADVGATTTLSVRVTASAPTYLQLIQTTAQTVPVVAGAITGSHAAPTVVASSTGLLSAVITPGSIDMPSPTFAYRWMQGSGPGTLLATTPTYQLPTTTPAASQPIWLELTATKANATPSPWTFLPSTPTNYGIYITGGATEIALPSPPAPRVGDGLVAQAPSSFTANGNPVSPTFTYQWARKTPTGAFVNIAAPLGTASSYTVVPTDRDYQFKVTITARAPGFAPTVLPESLTSQTAVLGEILTNGGAAVVTLTNPATNDYTASVPPIVIQTSGTTLSYKWYRAGSPNVLIGSAATYRLTALDAGKLVWVEVTASRAGFAPKPIPSNPVDYGLHANSTFDITDEDGGAIETGDFLRAGDGLDYLDSNSLSVAWTATYQWYRKVGTAAGVAIAGATGQRYELTSADKGNSVYAIATVRAPGRVPLTLTSTATTTIGTGPIDGTFVGAVVIPNGNGSLKVSLPSGFMNTTGVTTAYQWYRTVGLTRTLIAGATGATYTLTATDAAAELIDVNLTFSKSNLTVPVAMPIVAAGRDPRINPGAPSILDDDGTIRVGETLTADTGVFTDANLNPATTTVVWLRKIGATEVVVASGLTYVVPSGDFVAGSTTTYRIRVTPTAPGSIGLPVTSATPTGPLFKGQFVVNPVSPTVTLNPASMTLTATLTPGTTSTPSPVIAYQWVCDGIAITGATASTFKLSVADFEKDISVRLAIGRPNFEPAGPLPESNASDYSIYSPTTPSIGGTLMVGQILTANVGTYNDNFGGALTSSPSFGYTWYRQVGSGAKIVIGAAATYTATTADLGATTRISVRVSVAAAGYLGFGRESVPSTISQAFFQGTKANPTVTMNAATNTLTATVPAGAITDPSPTYSYQWLRGGSPIVGATTASYKLASPTDWNVPIQVRVTVTKAGFATEQLGPSTMEYYSIYNNVTPTIDGAMQVGTVASMSSVSWELRGATISPTIKYEWLRKAGSAAPVVVATTPTYVLQPIDAVAGTTISLRITPTYPGGVFGTTAPAMSSLTTTPRTVAGGVFTGSFVAATVTETKPTMTLSASLTPGSVDQTGLTLAYQWFRQTPGGPATAITGATAATYKLVEANDRNKEIFVRITFSKPGFVPASPLFSNPASYTLGASQTIQVSPTSPTVGSILQLSAAGYDYTPSSVTYQWYRKTGSAAGVAIIGTLGATSTYTVTAADTGSSIYAVVTATYPGYFSNVQTTTPVAVPGLPWAGSLAVPTVAMTNVATLTLTATLPAGSVTSTPFTGAWQWYRDSAATPIAGATTAVYKLTAADNQHTVFVRYIAAKALYDPLVLDSVPGDYSMHHDASGDWLRFFPTNDQQLRVGFPAEGGWGTVVNGSGTPVGTSVTTQWLRGTTVVGTGLSYTPQAADVGSYITEKITYTEAGYLPYTFSITSISPVAKGEFPYIDVGFIGTTIDLTMKATVHPPPELYLFYPSIKFTGPAGFTYTYQWFRDGAPIAGATSQSYQMTAAADQGKIIHGQITIARAGFVTAIAEGNPIYNSISFLVPATISDSTPVVGDVLSVNPGTCTNGGGGSWDCSSANPSYQWFVDNAPVSVAQGGTASTFTVPASAVGKVIGLRVHYPVEVHFTSPLRTVDTDPVAAP